MRTLHPYCDCIYTYHNSYCFNLIDVKGNSEATFPHFRCLNIVMYFSCQLDEPYGFPGDHQPDATLL